MAAANKYITITFFLIYVNKFRCAKLILPVTQKKVSIHLKPCFFSRIIGIIFTSIDVNVHRGCDHVTLLKFERGRRYPNYQITPPHL